MRSEAFEGRPEAVLIEGGGPMLDGSLPGNLGSPGPLERKSLEHRPRPAGQPGPHSAWAGWRRLFRLWGSNPERSL